MEKEFTQYEEALALKELGFDESCFGHYQQEWHNDGMTQLEPSLQMIVSKQHQHAFQLCSAPTYSQAFRWFREKHNLHIPINKVTGDGELVGWSIDSTPWNYFKTYEEAELACLKKLIEIVKSK